MSQWPGQELEGDAEDRRLIASYAADSEGRLGRRAASRLLGRHQRRVYAWCRGYCDDHERALELTQETLLRAFRKLDSFQGRARFSSWLFIVTRSVCLNAMERRPPPIAAGAEPDRLRTPALDPEEAMIARLGESQVLDLIETRLDGRERQALWLRCFERMPVASITRVLRIEDASGARAVLQSARRKLSAGLAERERLERREQL